MRLGQVTEHHPDPNYKEGSTRQGVNAYLKKPIKGVFQYTVIK